MFGDRPSWSGDVLAAGSSFLLARRSVMIELTHWFYLSISILRGRPSVLSTVEPRTPAHTLLHTDTLRFVSRRFYSFLRFPRSVLFHVYISASLIRRQRCLIALRALSKYCMCLLLESAVWFHFMCKWTLTLCLYLSM